MLINIHKAGIFTIRNALAHEGRLLIGEGGEAFRLPLWPLSRSGANFELVVRCGLVPSKCLFEDVLRRKLMVQV